jgi:NADP-dependent 3-hydroxy acid dehydrogenase YdfG
MRTAVVSGASGGIGAAIVRLLLQRGDRVVAIGRSADKLASLQGNAETGVLVPVVVDLAKPANLSEHFADLGDVDALVHCAGIAEVASVEESGHDLWQRTMTVNLAAAAELTRVLLPGLRSRRSGVVFVNLAPRTGVVPRWSAYVGSKAALTVLADALRAEEQSSGVRVTTIYPGGTATELLEEVRTQFGVRYDAEDCIEPETIARYVLLALDAPADAYLTDLSVAAIPGVLRER